MESPATSFAQIASHVGQHPPVSVILAHALTANIIRPVAEAARNGIVEAIFVGPEDEVRSALNRSDPEAARSDSIRIVDAATEIESLQTSVQLIRDGEGRVLVQGRVQFRDLRSAVETPDQGLGLGRQLSGLFLFEDPRPRSQRLYAITDHLVHPEPGEIEIRQSIENSVLALQKLGFESPNVALLSGTNRVMEEIESTQRAEKITRSFKRGVLEGCRVDGPFTLDVALDRQSAQARQIAAPVAGKADLLVAPRLDTARILVDTLHWLTGVRGAQVLLGSRVPIVLTSRSDRPEDRTRSLLLACSIA